MSITDKAAALSNSIRDFGAAVDAKTDDLVTEKQPLIPEATEQDFYAGSKTWVNFDQAVRSALLSGLSTAQSLSVQESDTVLLALGKLQAQLNQTSLGSHNHDSQYVKLTSIGTANGIASLGDDGKVPALQLPSYVDDVLEYPNYASLPAVGEQGKIYVTVDTNKQYRWSGSTYVYITSGAVDSVAGKTGVVTLSADDVGLGNVENKNSATIRGELTSLNVTTALGYTPYNASNPNGYIDASASISGNAATATKLENARSIAMTGDVAWSVASFDGGSNVTAVATLSNSGVVAGTYLGNSSKIQSFSVDEKGRVIAVGEEVDIAVNWSAVSGKPTTVAELGIGDIVSSDNATFYGPITESVGVINGSAALITPSNGTMQTWNLTQSASADFNLSPGQYVTLVVQNIGSNTITWSNVAWVDNYPPELATSGKTVLAFWNIDGSVMGAKVGELA